MSKPIPACSSPGCTEPNCARGMCRPHYMQWWKDQPKGERRCLGCSQPISGRGGRKFCSLTCRPRCVVDDCEDPAERAGTTLCLGHFAQKVRYGEARPHKFKWAAASPCRVCGVSNDYRLRAFCSFWCYQLWRRHDGEIPTSKPCVSCGIPLTLTLINADGSKRRRDLRPTFCKKCGNRRTKYDGATVFSIAERDGTDCALCEKPVDMTLRRNHQGGFWCASVDHIVPQSKGGTHDPANLQLAHLICNLLKSDRVEVPPLGGASA